MFGDRNTCDVRRLQVGGHRHGSRVYWALVDADEFARLAAHRWSICAKDGRLYVHRRTPSNGVIYLHRVVLGLADDDTAHVDHIDGNGLNNLRSNLRRATNAQNHQNFRPRLFGASRFRGVSWCKQTRRWRATVTLDGKQHHLGRFEHELDAAAAAQHFRLARMPYSVEQPLS